jgi:hypothetical protein
MFLMPMGRCDEALHQNALAVSADPLNMFFRTATSMYLVGTGQEDEGAGQLFRIKQEINAPAFVANFWLCAYNVRRGRLDEALALAEEAYALAPSSLIGILAGILTLAGDPRRASLLREKLGNGEAQGAPFALVCYHAVRGEIDAAAFWYAKAIDQRDQRTPWILAHAFGTAITSSSHWPGLAKMMNLPV